MYCVSNVFSSFRIQLSSHFPSPPIHVREGGEGRGGAVYGSSPPKSPTPHPKTLGRVGPVWRGLEGLATLVPLYSLQVLVATRLWPSPRVELGWDRGQEHFDRAHFLDIIKTGGLLLI